MKTVHKYRLEGAGIVTSLRVKEGYKVLRAEYLVVDKAIYLWVEEPLKADLPDVSLQLKVVNSGDPLPDDYLYRATALDSFGPESYHVFEIPAVDARKHLPAGHTTLVAA